MFLSWQPVGDGPLLIPPDGVYLSHFQFSVVFYNNRGGLQLFCLRKHNETAVDGCTKVWCGRSYFPCFFFAYVSYAGLLLRVSYSCRWLGQYTLRVSGVL